MADPIPTATHRSMTRARNRERLLILLNSWGEAHANRLATALGVPCSRVKWMMRGHPPQYSVELALIPLGLAAEVPTSHGRVYRITPLGRRKARSIVASWIRARERRAGRAAKGSDDRHVAPMPEKQVTVT